LSLHVEKEGKMFPPFHINAGQMFGNHPFGFESYFSKVKSITSPLAGSNLDTGTIVMQPKTALDSGGRMQFTIHSITQKMLVTCSLGRSMSVKVTMSLSGTGLGTILKVFSVSTTPIIGKLGLFIQFETPAIDKPMDVNIGFEADDLDTNPWNFYDCEIVPA
jgi:hypothetical protein